MSAIEKENNEKLVELTGLPNSLLNSFYKKAIKDAEELKIEDEEAKEKLIYTIYRALVTGYMICSNEKGE